MKFGSSSLPIEWNSTRGIPEKVFDNIMNACDDKLERAYLKDACIRKSLHYFDFVILGKQIALSNTLYDTIRVTTIPTFDKLAQEIAISRCGREAIHCSSEFLCTKAERGGLSSVNQARAINDFKSALMLKYLDPTFFNRIYGNSPSTALRSIKGSHKPPHLLPFCKVYVPLIYPTMQEWIISQTIDLNHTITSKKWQTNQSEIFLYIVAQLCSTREYRAHLRRSFLFLQVSRSLPTSTCKSVSLQRLNGLAETFQNGPSRMDLRCRATTNQS